MTAECKEREMILRYTIAWVPMVVIAIANGILREFGYGKYMGERPAHQIASVMGIIFFVLYIIPHKLSKI
jgi:hypothetical protein